MLKTNNERLQEIAEGMQSLNERLVYVGGAMAGSYANDPAAVEPRPTTDVDCVVDSKNYAEHAAVEEQLRKLHFQNDTESEPPVICRWVYNGEIVDVMSYEEKSLSFGNRWYRPGFEHREIYILPSGKQIYRLPVEQRTSRISSMCSIIAQTSRRVFVLLRQMCNSIYRSSLQTCCSDRISTKR